MKTRHESVSAKTEKALRVIIRQIREEPRRMDMDEWVIKFNPARLKVKSIGKRHTIVIDGRHRLKCALPPCGTIACLAGWARENAVLGTNDADVIQVRTDGTKALGITGKQASALFFSSSWPCEFHDSLAECKSGTKEYANVVAKRVLHFIHTGQ